MKSSSKSVAALLGTLAIVGSSVAACGEPADAEAGEITSVQSALTSAVDSFDDGDVSDWRRVGDAASTMEARISSSRAQSGTMSMKMTYTVSATGYVGVERVFSPARDWSAYAGLQMWVYGLGTNHLFQVQLYDAGGERFSTSFVVNFTGWQQKTIPFSAFARNAWQPPGATLNGVLDRAGMRGISFLPAVGGGQTGAVYVDSLNVIDSAALATALPAPPPLGPTGALVPLYSYPTSSTWTALVAAKLANPKVPVIAAINPGNGPGTTPDPNYVAGIKRLVDNGIKVIGYVYTSYAARPAADAKADVDGWRRVYPLVSGIFFDEMAGRAGTETYYGDLTAYAKARGMDFTLGNPGADVAPVLVGSVDMILIYESLGVPTMDRIGGWHEDYDRKNFGIIPYGTTLSASYVQQARQKVGYIYMTDDVMPNPWDSVPTYLNALFAELQR